MSTPMPWWQNANFPFIRIPKELFQNPYYADLSAESKTLYGFLLDRVCRSWEKGESWRTPRGEPFVIYTLQEIQDRFDCGKAKASKLLQALTDHRLVDRVRPKRDEPYHILVYPPKQRVSADTSEVRKSNLPRYENRTCPGTKTEPAEVRKSNLNNTKNNKTHMNNTHLIREEAEREIKKQIEYDLLIREKDKLQWDGILEVMVDAYTATDDPVLRKKLLKVDSMRMDYVTDRLKQSKVQIGSYRSFVLARLTEPEAAVDAFYDAWVRSDLSKGTP